VSCAGPVTRTAERGRPPVESLAEDVDPHRRVELVAALSLLAVGAVFWRVSKRTSSIAT